MIVFHQCKRLIKQAWDEEDATVERDQTAARKLPFLVYWLLGSLFAGILVLIDGNLAYDAAHFGVIFFGCVGCGIVFGAAMILVSLVLPAPFAWIARRFGFA